MRLSSKLPLVAALVAMSGFAASAGAVTVYDESVSGDLSNSGLSATAIATALGSNEILGTTGKSAGVIDRDYFTITLLPGTVLSGITLLPGSAVSGTFSFIGVQAGTQVTVPSSPSSAAGLLGWTHYSEDEIGTDILPTMGVPANGSTGFTPPLTAGSYAFWVQDTGNGPVHYGFDFAVTAVPEPGMAGLMLAGLAAVGVAVGRRRSRAAG
jgi:hypothetical protein